MEPIFKGLVMSGTVLSEEDHFSPRDTQIAQCSKLSMKMSPTRSLSLDLSETEVQKRGGQVRLAQEMMLALNTEEE